MSTRKRRIKEKCAVLKRVLNPATSGVQEQVGPERPEQFASFFQDQVLAIRRETSASTDCTPYIDSRPVACPLTNFTLVSEETVRRTIKGKASKSCILDPIPTWLLKETVEDHIPTITRLINSSLQSGIFPSKWKSAVVTPLLKGPSLDKQHLKNYRPVSNTPFLAKVTEKLVCQQLEAHLT